MRRGGAPLAVVQRRCRWVESGIAGISGLKLIEATREFAGEAGAVDLEITDDAGEVIAGSVEEFGEEMLDLDVVVRP